MPKWSATEVKAVFSKEEEKGQKETCWVFVTSLVETI